MLASTETLKLFDTSLYPTSRPEAVAEDMAGLFIEAGKKPLEQRINPRKFKIVDGKVHDTESGKEVPGNLKRDTPLSTLEANSAEPFYDQLANGYSLVVAISASGGISPYKEGRVNVGYRISHDEIEFYGIPTYLSPEALLAKTILLSEFSDMSLSKITTPDELRGISIPILIPPDEVSPWDFLEEVLPLDSDAWNAIKMGKPWVIKENAIKDARSIAPAMVKMIKTARTERDFLIAGAYGEREMEMRGWKLNYGSCPGKSNSELLNATVDGRMFATDAFGNTRETTGWEYHTGRCVNCGASEVSVGPCSICKTCEKIL